MSLPLIYLKYKMFTFMTYVTSVVITVNIFVTLSNEMSTQPSYQHINTTVTNLFEYIFGFMIFSYFTLSSLCKATKNYVFNSME